MSAATILAQHVLANCEVEGSLPARPASLTHRTAFVAPSEPWKQDDDEGFCDFTVGLDVYLVAGAADLVESFDWLDAQTSALMSAGVVDVKTDEIAAITVSAPFVFSDGSGASYLTARVTYSRFRS